MGRSPGKPCGHRGSSTMWCSPPTTRSMPAPSTTVRIRSTPGKAEKGPSEVTSARLTRQSKASAPAPSGPVAISRVSPPPFLQGAGARPAARRIRTVTGRSPARGRRPARAELGDEPVVQLAVRDLAGVGARVEVPGVVDRPLGGDGQLVELAQEVELVAPGVAEADELPEQGQLRGLAEIALGGELVDRPAVRLEDDQGGCGGAAVEVVVDDGVHRQVVARLPHAPEACHDRVDPAVVVVEGDVGDRVDVGGEEDDGDRAVVVEVGGQAQDPVGQRLDAAVLVVGLHRTGVVEDEVDGGTVTAQAVLLQGGSGALVEADQGRGRLLHLGQADGRAAPAHGRVRTAHDGSPRSVFGVPRVRA
ncbi:hypothetical protein SBADM41S_10809 [Streptomyces badius]